MAPTQLVFVEGITGAGKSTTAAHVEKWLVARGEAARRYHEMDDDNPIRTKGVDAMRSHHPQAQRLPGVGEDGFAIDPSVYGADQWSALARRALDGETTWILESRYMQNSVQPRFMAGAPPEKVIEGFRRIVAGVAPAAPLLVYLRPENLWQHLQKTIGSRSPEWSRWFIDGFSGYGWSRARGLLGEDAVVGFYEEWEAIAAELFAIHEGPGLWLTDPQLDWNASLEKIYKALRG